MVSLGLCTSSSYAFGRAFSLIFKNDAQIKVNAEALQAVRTAPHRPPESLGRQLFAFQKVVDNLVVIRNLKKIEQLGKNVWLRARLKKTGLFDSRFYLEKYPDVGGSGLDADEHYLRYGALEGRQPNRLFCPRWYAEYYPNRDIRIRDALFDYAKTGWRQGCDPHPNFSVEAYLETYPDVRLSGTEPLSDFLQRDAGSRLANPSVNNVWQVDIIRNSGLFNAAWYLGENPDIRPLFDRDPAVHYFRHGAAEGRAASLLFDTKRYTACYPECHRLGLNPIVHWIKHNDDRRFPEFAVGPGFLSGLQPSADENCRIEAEALLIRNSGLFDPEWYSAANCRDPMAQEDPLRHFVTVGGKAGLNPSTAFNANAYLEANRDIALRGVSPLTHWLEVGRAEGRSFPGGKVESKAKPTLDAICSLNGIEHGEKFFDSSFMVSIVTATYETEVRYLEQLCNTIQNQTYRNWEWIIVDNGSSRADLAIYLDNLHNYDNIKVIRLAENMGISDATNIGIKSSNGNFIAFIDHDDAINRNVLYEAWQNYKENNDVDLFYTDECKLGSNGEIYDIFYKPDWSPALLEATMYIGHLTIYSVDFLARIGLLDQRFDGAQDYELALRAIKSCSKVCHIPIIGYLWRAIPGSTASGLDQKSYALDRQRNALEAYIASRVGWHCAIRPGFSAGFWYIDFANDEPANNLTFIVRAGEAADPCADLAFGDLKRCVEHVLSICANSLAEIVVLNSENLSPDQCKALTDLDSKVVICDVPEAWPEAAKFNTAVSRSKGKYVAIAFCPFLFVGTGDVSGLVNYLAANPSVGSVAPVSTYLNGRILSNGVAIIDGNAVRCGSLLPNSYSGHFGNLKCRRNVSALGDTVLITSRASFELAGGFSGDGPCTSLSVEYCLQLRTMGLYCVVDPNIAIAMRYRGESLDAAGSKFAFTRRESTFLDPYYSGHLIQADGNFRTIA